MNIVRISLLLLFMSAVTNTSLAGQDGGGEETEPVGQDDGGEKAEPECD